jgi:ubiquinone/menaquinone biosynthesis C-methylase UbiE
MANNKSMDNLRDPENNELKHLLAACQLPGKFVLEIGCGNGVLTRQYAHFPRRVIGIDPKSAELHQAATAASATKSKAFFIRGIGEAIPFPPRTFDVVIFASSL